MPAIQKQQFGTWITSSNNKKNTLIKKKNRKIGYKDDANCKYVVLTFLKKIVLALT